MIEEGNRRRLVRYLELDALCLTGAGIQPENRYKALMEIRQSIRGKLYPWMVKTPTQTAEDYIEYYNQVMTAWKRNRDRKTSDGGTR